MKRCIDADFPLSRFQYIVLGLIMVWLRESLLDFSQIITFGIPLVLKNGYWVDADVKKWLILLCVNFSMICEALLPLLI